MSKEKLYGLRDQISKFLYDPTPEQSAQRDKLWDEGRFDESKYQTKYMEEQLEYVEKQIEAVEAAEPSLGERIVTNTLLNLPWGRGERFPGLGSLLGWTKEELLGLTEEKEREVIEAGQKERLTEIELELKRLGDIEGMEEDYFKLPYFTTHPESIEYGKNIRRAEGLDRELVENALNQEKKGIMSLLGMTPTEEEIEGIMSMVPEKIENLPAGYKPPTQEEEYQLSHHPIVSEEFAQRNPTVVHSPYDRSEVDKKLYPSRLFTLKLDEAELQKLSPEDAKEAEKLLKRNLKRQKPLGVYSTEEAEAWNDYERSYDRYFDALKYAPEDQFRGTAGEVARIRRNLEKGTRTLSTEESSGYWPDPSKETKPDIFNLTRIERVPPGKYPAEGWKGRLGGTLEIKDANPWYVDGKTGKLYTYRGEPRELVSFDTLKDEDLPLDVAAFYWEKIDEIMKKAQDYDKYKRGYQGGGLIMNYGDYGRSYK